MAMDCPICGYASHVRTSKKLSNKTKRKYYQCQNLECSTTFKTLESFEEFIVCSELKPKTDSS